MKITNIKKINSHLIRFQDYFLHDKIRSNADLLYRARILSLHIISIMAVAVAVLLVVIFTPSLTSLRIATLIATGVTISIMTCALYRLKYRGEYRLCCFIIVIFAFCSISLGGMVTGGPFQSPTFQLIVIPSIMAYFFGGVRWGVTTSLTALLCIIILQAADILGFEFPLLIIEPQINRFVLLINLPAVAIFALIYEITAISQKNARDLQNKKYAEMATKDSLTGLPNRRIFSETLVARMELCQKVTPALRFTLCYLDLDRFKPINDQFGHGIGDEVLKNVSERLRLALRGADFVGRIGGDEFMILLGETYEVEAIDVLAMRYLKLIREPIKTSAGFVGLDGSLGFAIYPDHGTDALSLERAADIAMYEAKKSRNGYLIYTPELPSR